jgi:hypothetical protein
VSDLYEGEPDLNEVRINAGAGAMNTIEAIDEETMALACDMAVAISLYATALLERGLPLSRVMGLIAAFAIDVPMSFSAEDLERCRRGRSPDG